jgi:hypothetical protein
MLLVSIPARISPVNKVDHPKKIIDPAGQKAGIPILRI